MIWLGKGKRDEEIHYLSKRTNMPLRSVQRRKNNGSPAANDGNSPAAKGTDRRIFSGGVKPRWWSTAGWQWLDKILMERWPKSQFSGELLGVAGSNCGSSKGRLQLRSWVHTPLNRIHLTDGGIGGTSKVEKRRGREWLYQTHLGWSCLLDLSMSTSPTVCLLLVTCKLVTKLHFSANVPRFPSQTMPALLPTGWLLLIMSLKSASS